MKHSCLINGYDSLNLTKLDILDALKEIQIAVKYFVDGVELEGFPGQLLSCYHLTRFLTIFPADLELLAKVDVEYVTLPGWNSPITELTTYEALPANCKKYIEFIEKFLNVPIEWIGVGPGRQSMLKKSIQ